MESIVFANSPLAEYLEGNGQGAGDWGIEPADDTSSSTSASAAGRSSRSSKRRSFAPSLSARATAPRAPAVPSRPPAAGSSRKARFYELFSRAIDSRLSRRENARFLERFRYIIVASQLLNGHVNVSHYDRKLSADHLFSEDEPTDFFGTQYAKVRYWVGGGGFMIVSSLLLSWVWRGGSINKGRAVAALMLSFVVAVFLFADARRRWLRSLRSKVIELAAQFVENSQAFDILASNAITLIQEVELVSRGYRLSAPLPPITRLDRDSQNRRCARLRKSILSALNLCIPPHDQACASLRDLVEEMDLEKYFDIYDIQDRDLAEAELGINMAEFHDMESLKALKTLLHRLHTIRRIFLCSLLSFDTGGGHAEYTKWKMVMERLHTLGNIVGELSGELRRIMDEEEHFTIPSSPKSPISPENEKYRGQLRKLNSLSQALRGLQAKMHVLREESDRSLREKPSAHQHEFGAELLSHYDSIGADLRGLVDEWESGRAYLALCVDRNGAAATNTGGAPSPESDRSISGTTLVGDTPRNSGLFSSDTWGDVAALAAIEDAATPQENDGGEEELVFEAVAEPRPKSMLSREERIRKVQEERARTAERRKTAEAGLAMQKELQQVLINRPPPRKRIMSRNFS